MPRPSIATLTLALFFLPCCLFAAEPASRETEVFEQRFKTDIAPLLSKRCTECHGTEKKKGGVQLHEAPTLAAVLADTEKWLALIEQVSTRQMPPEDKPKLSDKEAETLTNWATAAVALADSRRPKDPGFVLPRRLNRIEYNNTLRDLLGIDLLLAEEFPVDDTGYGFDNIAAVLAMSPLLTEKYLDAAELAIEVGFGAPNPRARNDGSQLKRKQLVLTDGVKYNAGQLAFLSTATAKYTMDCKVGTEYELIANAWQDKAGTEPSHGEFKIDGKLVDAYDVKESEAVPQKFKRHFKATAAKHEVSLSFTNDFYDQKSRADRNLYFGAIKIEPVGGAGADDEFAKRVIVSKPGPGVSDEQAAESVLRKFATRAYRRPVAAGELQKLMNLYKGARKDLAYQPALKRALSAVLVSPHFLMRTEARPANATGNWDLGDYEIASRLSYFFWSSMPDETLFDLAEKKQLHDPAVRAREVKRMLADPKSKALVKNFAGQWLELRNLDEVSFNGRRFPEWNGELASAMRRECEMLFDEIIKQDHSVMDFIDPGFTFVNEKLAKHYGIKGVTGDEFKRVETKGTKRGGILSMGSTLAVTSNPTRTSPVKRGKWILEQVLGTPPPPPPPDVPALADKAKDEADSPLRQRLEKHRADPNCAVCHNRMDGYGFALENFDAIGRWRDTDGKFPVDAVGSIPGEDPIKGVDDLKKVVLKRKPQFVRNFAEKLLTYALGRGINPHDRATVNQIIERADAAGDKFSSVVIAIVESDAFLKRRDQLASEK